MTVIALASDHGGFALKETVKDHLNRRGHRPLDFGCDRPESVDWPEVLYPAAMAVSGGEAEVGILMDGAGFSAGMIANRLPNLRAAVCWDTECARLAREHVDANVLCIGGKLLETALALEIVDKFLSTAFVREAKYERRVAQLESYSQQHSTGFPGVGQQGKRKLITAEDVIRAASLGRILDTGPDDMLTPEARDLLDRLRHNLRKEQA